MSAGWIKLHRKILDNPLFDDSIMFTVFVRLLLMAQRQKYKSLDIGEVYVNLTRLATQIGVSRQAVKRRILRARLATIIRTRAVHGGTIVKILNFKDYQAVQNDTATYTRPTLDPSPDHPIKQEEEERRRIHTSPTVTLSASADAFMDLWNRERGSLPGARALTDKRRRQIKSRLAKNPDFEYWRQVIVRMRSSPFLRGEKSDWRGATFDFLLKPDTHIRVMEGAYDDGTPDRGGREI